jgi:undecaprenyl-diphosphatase
VVVTEKLLGLDPSSPPMTLLLVMLHTGTMFAVIVYFWKQWRETYFLNSTAFKKFATLVVIATTLTGLIGEGLTKIIEKFYFHGVVHAEIENLFSHLELIAPALAVAGVLILVAGFVENKNSATSFAESTDLSMPRAGIIGAMQGLCLPFRGFSRSGATISTGMLLGLEKKRAEMFSFALAVVLTPPVVLREVLRVVHAGYPFGTTFAAVAFSSLLGAIFAFLAGLLALKWLSGWLESGKWYLFGIYCLIAALVVGYLHHLGY